MSKDKQEFYSYDATDLYLYFRSQDKFWDMRVVEQDPDGKEKYPIAKGNKFISDLSIKNKHFSGSIYVTPYDLQYTYDGEKRDDGAKWRKYLAKHRKEYVPQSLAYLEQERAKWLEHKNNLAVDGLAYDLAENKLQEIEGHREEILTLQKDEKHLQEEEQTKEQL